MKAIITILSLSFLLFNLSNIYTSANSKKKENNIARELNEESKQYTSVSGSLNYKKDIELTGENENPVSYKFICSNFIKTGNTTIFDISIQNIGSEQIWLRSIQCVFRFPRNNVSNLIVASNYYNFWQMPTLITDTIIYVAGLTYEADTNWIPVTSEKIFTVRITGNIDSIRWSNNTIQRTKLFGYPYVEITDSTYHIIDRITSVKLNESELPSSYSLSQNYPNPFNPSTIICYALTNGGFTSVIVYNALGREVITLVNEIKKAGYYSMKFDASGLAAGVYFYKLESANYVSVKKMILLK